MASIIRLKRSTSTGNPGKLGQGELAYSSLAGTQSNGGDRLYYGQGTETAGDALEHVVIGGKYFTDMLDHVNGTLTANSAIITDSDSKINLLKVDNVQIDGNTVSTLDTNGNLVLAPNGTGLVSIASAYTLPRVDGADGYVLTAHGDGTTTWAAPATYLSLAGDSSSTGQIDLLTETLTFAGSNGITASVNSGTNTVGITVTTATASVKGIASFSSADFLVSTGAVSLVASRISDLVNATLTDGQSIGLSYDSGTNKLTVSADVATTSVIGVASFSSANFEVTDGEVAIKDGGVSNAELANSSVTFGSTTVALGGTSTTLSGVTRLNVDNLDFDSNEISATDTNGNISLKPNGTGTVAVNSARISGLADPVNPQDAATKAYVDATRAGLFVKDAVRAATTANITLSNTQTIDGVALAVGNRVLVKNQAVPSENGVYVVSNTAWTRPNDFKDSDTVKSGAFFFVTEGNDLADSGWVLTTDGTITVDNTNLAFAQFSGAGQIIAGDAITKSGNRLDVVVAAAGGIEISADALQLKSTVAGDGLTYTNGVIDVVGTTDRLTVSANAIDIAATYVGQTSIVTVGTVATGTWAATEVAAIHGGTGQTTYSVGDILVAGANNTLTKLGIGAEGTVLQSNGTTLVYGDIDGGTY